MLNISFKLIDHGWIQAILLNEDKEVIITASYLSDAPNDLVIAVALLLEGVNDTVCRWEKEPGEYRWIFRRDNDSINIQVLLFNQSFSRQSDESGQIIISAKEGLIKFAQQIVHELNMIVSDDNTESYKNCWGYEFPVNAINRLKSAIKKAKS